MATPFRMIWFTSFTCRNWDVPDTRNQHWLEPHMYLDAAHRLETHGLFEAIVLADVLAMPSDYENSTDLYVKKGVETVSVGDSLTLLAAMSARTRDIGLVSTQSTTLFSPELMAQTIGSLDCLTAGRAGWNMVTSVGRDLAWNFGMDALPPGDVRYDRADGFVDEVLGLWRGATAGDPDHAGLHLPPSPQEHPVLMQAGGSERGREFAARHAEMVVTHCNTVEAMKAFRDDMRSRMARIGRDPDTCKVFFTMKPVIAATRAEAEAILAEQRDRPSLDVETGLAIYSGRIGADLSGYPLDAPLPDDVAGHGPQGLLQQHRDGAKPTLRDIARAEAVKDSYLVLGTPEEAADQMAAAMDAVGGDGFAVRETFHPSLVAPIVDELMPVLRERGLTRSSYRHDTLRANLFDQDFASASPVPAIGAAK